MARVSLSEFSNTIDNIGIDFLSHRAATLPLGRWTIGAAVGELSFEGVPSFTLPTKATERQRKDNKAAMVLTGLKPRWCFDSWIAARQELADFLNEEHRLETLGYTAEALRIELTNWAVNKTNSREDSVWVALGRHVARVHGYMVEAVSTYEKLSRDFGGFNETEAQQAAFDLALIEDFKEMAPHEKAAMLATLARPDGTADKRTLVALFRVPPVLTGLNDQGLNEIGAAYFRSEWPQTAEAMVALNQCIGAAHDALGTAVKVISDRIGKPAENLPGVSEDAVEWLRADFAHSFSFAPPTSWA